MVGIARDQAANPQSESADQDICKRAAPKAFVTISIAIVIPIVIAFQGSAFGVPGSE